jgi:hypothetical protein
VAELADALHSGCSARQGVEVRVLSSAPSSLSIPEKHKAQWLKEVFEFTDTEMAHVLGISSLFGRSTSGDLFPNSTCKRF